MSEVLPPRNSFEPIAEPRRGPSFAGHWVIMQLDLTQEDARVLRDTIHDYLPELRREVARTDERTMRHELARRQDLCERLLARLEQP